MRQRDVGLLVLIAALVVPVGLRSGTMEAVTFVAVLGPILVCALILGVFLGLLRGVARWWRRRRGRSQDDLLDDREDLQDDLTASPQAWPRQGAQDQATEAGDDDEPTRKATPSLADEAGPEDPDGDDLEEIDDLEDEPTRKATPSLAGALARPGAAPAPALPEEPLPDKVMGPAFVGTTPFGAAIVPTADGGRVIVVVMPVTDGSIYDKAPAFPEGSVKAVIATSRQQKGALGSARVARLAGLDHVYQLTEHGPVDRGVEIETIEVKTIGEGTEIGGVLLKPDPMGLRATWPDGATAVFGDAIPLERVFRPDVGVLIGGFVWSTLGPARPGVPRVVPVPGVVGSADAHELADLLGKRGVSVSVSGPPREKPLPEMPTEHDVVMQIVDGTLDEAEHLARRRLAADLDPARMGFQLGVIAWMRGDDPTAQQELERAAMAGVTEANATLAGLLVSQRDDRALDHARQALEALPDEPMILKTAVLVYLQMGDSTGASRILVERGEILAERDRRELVQLVDRPFALGPPGSKPTGTHRFPYHARAAATAARQALAEERTEEALRLLRRAVELDPAETEHVIELGTLLSRQGRDADAIELYTSAIDRGGLHEVLRFNRATCHVRAGELAEAIVDLQVCVDLVEGWHAARVNLCSALWTTGDREGALRELERLRAEGAPAKWVDALTAQIAPEPTEPPTDQEPQEGAGGAGTAEGSGT